MDCGTPSVDWNQIPAPAADVVCGSLRKLADLKSVLIVSKAWLSAFDPHVRRSTPWRRLGCKELPVREHLEFPTGPMTLVAESQPGSSSEPPLVCVIHRKAIVTCFESRGWVRLWQKRGDRSGFGGLANFDGNSFCIYSLRDLPAIGLNVPRGGTVDIYEAASGEGICRNILKPDWSQKFLIRNGVLYSGTKDAVFAESLKDSSAISSVALPGCSIRIRQTSMNVWHVRVRARPGKGLLIFREYGRHRCIVRLNWDTLEVEAHRHASVPVIFSDVHEDRFYRVVDDTVAPRRDGAVEDCALTMFVSPMASPDETNIVSPFRPYEHPIDDEQRRFLKEANDTFAGYDPFKGLKGLDNLRGNDYGPDLSGDPGADPSVTAIVPLSSPHLRAGLSRLQDADFRVLFDRIYFVARYEAFAYHPLYVLDAYTGDSLYRVTGHIDSLVLSEVLPRTFYTSDSEGRTHVWYEGADIADVPDRYPHREEEKMKAIVNVDPENWAGSPDFSRTGNPERDHDAKKRKTS